MEQECGLFEILEKFATNQERMVKTLNLIKIALIITLNVLLVLVGMQLRELGISIWTA